VLDGLAFVQAREEADRAVLYDAVRGMARTMALCSHVLCYTSRLEAEVAGRGHPPVRVDGCASAEMAERAAAARAATVKDPGFVTVGFAGGHPGHAFNFRMVEDTLLDLLGRHPRLRLTLLGPLATGPGLDAFGERVRRVPYMDWRKLPFEIARLDVAIAPLEDHPFNQCKSHLKYLEAGLCGVPLVASRVGQLAETVADGATGFLVSSPAEWRERLETLIGDPCLRSAMGERARRDVLAHWTTRARGRRLRAALERVLREAHPRRRRPWWSRASSR
jgi:glycosyltransferase involved in cell wall biosynthesis